MRSARRRGQRPGLTEAERRHLMSAMAKIYRAAVSLTGDERLPPDDLPPA